MGRQAYLAKLAFGRSAFEPTRDVAQSNEYIQLHSSQADLPQRYQEFNGNNYIQLYDERGNPINPRSREYGKKFRNAQNDVLAAVGVVERRRSPIEGVPGSYEERLQELDIEDTIGNALGATFTITENLCTWWIGTIRDRVMTFRYHDAMPFARIVALEHAVSGPSIVYTSLVPRIFATICTSTVLYNVFVYQPLVRFMHLTHASPRIRKLYRLSKGVLRFGLRLGLEILFYPFSYHADLQRLGFIPAQPYLPSWKSLIPLSRSSPLVPFSLYYDPTTSWLHCAKAVLTSPLVLVCAEHFFELWLFATINEAVDSSVVCPDNPDVISPDASNRHRVTTILGFRQRSPPLVRKAIKRLMMALGWGGLEKPNEADRPPSFQSSHQNDPINGQTIDLGSATITNVTPLELGVAQTQSSHPAEVLDVDILATSVIAVDDLERPPTPLTPLVSDTQNDDDDPRIRITSREGIVEMEVRLPPRILSTHTEIADAVASSQAQHHEEYPQNSRPYHRVSQLSLESADKISAIVKTQLVALAVLPFKLVVLRLVASHYLASHSLSTGISRDVVPLPSLKDLTWRSIGTQASRLALCSVLQVAIDLSLWSIQYAISLNLGKRLFGWGAL